VVSTDVIEHLPEGDRVPALVEMFRAAGQLIVVGFPYGSRTSLFDKAALAEERKRGSPPDWREEHVSRGIPSETIHQRIIELVDRCKAAEVYWFPHEGVHGLSLRWKLQFLVPRSLRSYGLFNYSLFRILGRGRPRFAWRRVYVIRFGDS